jgi:hypothetical protein
MYNSLIERSLDLAAGTAVDAEAYGRWSLNLAKLQSLGKGYRQGWLQNVFQRITPLTVREMDDYLMMADLFILTRMQAEVLLQLFGQDITRFATQAGVPLHENTQELQGHVGMYRAIGQVLSNKFGLTVPPPFRSVTMNGLAEDDSSFIRGYLNEAFERDEATRHERLTARYTD